MTLGHEAYEQLYRKPARRRIIIKYHGGLKEYNATVTQSLQTTTFRLSKQLKDCEPEIQIGVIQHLLNKLNKTNIKTDNIDFYHNFVKRMSDYAPVTHVDPLLEESFTRMNNTYFHGMMSKPNLMWGNRTMTLLGTYTYASDTIKISTILEDAPEELLDYVMYHEMLHKKHKFSCSSGRTHSHTPAFKRDEAKYTVVHAEQRLSRFLAGARQQKQSKKERSFLARVMGWN